MAAVICNGKRGAAGLIYGLKSFALKGHTAGIPWQVAEFEEMAIYSDQFVKDKDRVYVSLHRF